jgi:hypothetical protein
MPLRRFNFEACLVAERIEPSDRRLELKNEYETLVSQMCERQDDLQLLTMTGVIHAAGRIFYEDRFLESWAGPIITNPSTAIVELVANCWDAYATEVKISWPDPKKNQQFSIADNGRGMTKTEFDYIWRAMSYDRIAKSGATAEPPPGVAGLPRSVFPPVPI